MNKAIETLSQILEDHQTKLKSLAVSAPDYYKNLNKLDGSNLETLTIHPRDYLVDLLTEWSRQFLETCCELQTNSHSHERCKEIIGWDDFLDKASTKDGTSVTDNKESSLEELRMRYKSLVLTLENQLEETRKEVYNLQKNLDFSKLDEDKLDGALSNIQGSFLKTQERVDLQKSLDLSKLDKDKLDGALSNIQGNLLKTQELETYPEVESNLHKQQLQSMSSIKDLKTLVRGRPHRFIENLAEVNKTKKNKVCSECGQARDRNDIKSARDQQEGKSNVDGAERLWFTNSINELTKQLHDQQSHNTKFATINDGLVELGRTQASQVRKLQEKIKLLQQRLIRKSKEANKVSKALRNATKAVSLNRKQCEILRSKLEQCKKDLSRYCVEDMTSWKSET